ncbi:MAG: FtsX-like permease family protein, partial [Muribaculaceae bacterium]|nr:FtsX-like permease family protein [Muribaculaceae bacterium]
GIYCSNFGEYDDLMAFVSLSTLRKIWGIGSDESTRIEITGIPFEQIQPAARALQEALAQAYYARELPDYLRCRSVLETGALYFNWLNLLDTNVLVIIILMASISVFTLIASLFILILERINLIGTLKTLGATDGLIRRVFIILASKILIKGLVIGNILALAIIIVQSFTHVLPLDPEAYYISFVPMNISLLQVITVNVAAVIAGVLVMIIPSMVISRMSPAKTVRFE